MKTSQTLVHYRAGCFACGKACDAKNATAWAHNHVRTHPGHTVELSLGYVVKAGGKMSGAEKQGELTI